VLPTWLAVDLEYVSHDGPEGMDRALPVKSEIALIPPISGG
jgi:molybdopterin converting factor small subunit